VRFLGNRSTGRQGYALARAAAQRGATVTLVAANVALPDPDGVMVLPVETTDELREQVRTAATGADIVVMAAAVADFRPVDAAQHKIKKVDGRAVPAIELRTNPDILAELVLEPVRPGQVLVGFAAETGDERAGVLEHGRAKARRKGADLLVINDVSGGRGFAVTTNEVTIVDRTGQDVARAAGTKDDVAHAVWDAVVPLLAPAEG
jgi:phosphopantothenoylcysteine decarboxylase/phosphopantothenate--cysteine ligase